MNIKLRTFASQVHYMNGMYKLPIAPRPSVYSVINNGVAEPVAEGHLKDMSILRLKVSAFHRILRDEVEELKQIEDSLSCALPVKDNSKSQPAYTVDEVRYSEIDFLTDMADLLGDVIVFCRSEAVKYGIPLEEVLSIIMESNFSKLGADGVPIYDADGKVQKGPFYWKPEPKIRELLKAHIAEGAL